jgi:dihydroorotase (multifunctional complex type)
MNVVTIINGKIVDGDMLVAADLVIENGTITEICQPGFGRKRGEVLDAEGHLILPGAIDIHFHCRAPAYPERGDFASETRGAAAGGVTTIFEMPISKPGAATLEVFENRRRLAEHDAYVNFGLYAAPALLDAAEIEKMVNAGAIGFKTFMTGAPEGRADEFEGLCATTDDELYRVLELLKPYAQPAVFHSESSQLLDLFESRTAGIQNFPSQDHALTRPPVVEGVAVAKLIAMVMDTQRPVHIAHLSSEIGLEFIRDAQRRNLPVTAETCPHYLLFTSDALREARSFAKVNPPIRGNSDRLALWTGLEDKTISILASDHSPFTAAEKQAAWEDIRIAPPGIPSIDILYHLVLDMALSGRFSLERAIELISTGPAKMYNLYPQKGIIRVGSDADLVLFNPEGVTTLNSKNWHSKAAPSDRLYTGMQLRGELCQTIVGGKVVYRQGEILGERGGGRFVRPPMTGIFAS